MPLMDFLHGKSGVTPCIFVISSDILQREMPVGLSNAPRSSRLCREELRPRSAPTNALLLIPVGAGTGHPCGALPLPLHRAAPLQEQPLQFFKAVSCVAAVNGEEMTWLAPGPCPCGRACAVLQAGAAWPWLWVVQEEWRGLALQSPPRPISPFLQEGSRAGQCRLRS